MDPSLPSRSGDRFETNDRGVESRGFAPRRRARIFTKLCVAAELPMSYTQCTKLAPIMGVFYTSNVVNSDQRSEEVTMQKEVLAIFASILLVAAGTVAASADTGAQHKHIAHHKNVAGSHHDITSFSSSAVLHVGVNHPPKNK
jgi:hypothetical protein